MRAHMDQAPPSPGLVVLLCCAGHDADALVPVAASLGKWNISSAVVGGAETGAEALRDWLDHSVQALVVLCRSSHLPHSSLAVLRRAVQQSSNHRVIEVPLTANREALTQRIVSAVRLWGSPLPRPKVPIVGRPVREDTQVGAPIPPPLADATADDLLARDRDDELEETQPMGSVAEVEAHDTLVGHEVLEATSNGRSDVPIVRGQAPATPQPVRGDDTPVVGAPVPSRPADPRPTPSRRAPAPVGVADGATGASAAWPSRTGDTVVGPLPSPSGVPSPATTISTAVPSKASERSGPHRAALRPAVARDSDSREDAVTESLAAAHQVPGADSRPTTLSTPQGRPRMGWARPAIVAAVALTASVAIAGTLGRAWVGHDRSETRAEPQLAAMPASPPRPLEVIERPATAAATPAEHKLLEALRRRELLALDVLLITPTVWEDMKYVDAERHCAALIVAGMDGWRVPSIGELHSLADARMLEKDIYWSSTPGDTFGDVRLAWHGGRRQIVRHDDQGTVLCVRDHDDPKQ